MPGRPFLFCRYQLSVKGEVLTPGAQFQLMAELQGNAQFYRRRDGEPIFDTMIMRPRQSRAGRYQSIKWSVGYIVDTRVRANYDAAADSIAFEYINDGGVRYSDFVAVPSLGVLAVDDRAGEIPLGGKAAIARFKSVIRSVEGADVDVNFVASPQELDEALQNWRIKKFNFIIRPNNPRPVSRLAEALSAQMRADGIGTFTGSVKPADGQHIVVADEGIVRPATDLANAGYGQVSVAGTTPEGLEAEIKRPQFDRDLEKNERRQAKQRELRVYVDDDGIEDEEILDTVAVSLVGFHTRRAELPEGEAEPEDDEPQRAAPLREA